VHHGRVVKRNGDGAIIEFRSVVDAVRCAIEVRSGLAERNAGLPPEKRIEYRVGINFGDVVEGADGDAGPPASRWPTPKPYLRRPAEVTPDVAGPYLRLGGAVFIRTVSRGGSLTLSDVQGPTLAVVCEPCGRRGRFDVGKLIEQHGADAKLTDLLAVLADNCPKARSISAHDRCKAVYEGLTTSR
jgi:hypothetical protein